MGRELRRPGRPKGPSRRPSERRAALLDAAEAAIRRHGPDTSMAQVAEQAGVSKATVYDNFDGKAALADALLERYGYRLINLLAQGLDTPMTPREVLRNGVDAFVAFVEQDPDVFRYVLAGNGNRALIDEAAGPIAEMVGAVLRQAGADAGGAEPYTRALLGGVFAAADWWAAQRTLSRDAFVDYVEGLFWSGLTGAGVSRYEGPVDLSGIARAIAATPTPE